MGASSSDGGEETRVDAAHVREQDAVLWDAQAEKRLMRKIDWRVSPGLKKALSGSLHVIHLQLIPFLSYVAPPAPWLATD